MKNQYFGDSVTIASLWPAYVIVGVASSLDVGKEIRRKHVPRERLLLLLYVSRAGLLLVSVAMVATSRVPLQIPRASRVWGSLGKVHETWIADDDAKDSKLAG